MYNHQFLGYILNYSTWLLILDSMKLKDRRRQTFNLIYITFSPQLISVDSGPEASLHQWENGGSDNDDHKGRCRRRGPYGKPPFCSEGVLLLVVIQLFHVRSGNCLHKGKLRSPAICCRAQSSTFLDCRPRIPIPLVISSPQTHVHVAVSNKPILLLIVLEVISD